jgi:hypothetical protein
MSCLAQEAYPTFACASPPDPRAVAFESAGRLRYQISATPTGGNFLPLRETIARAAVSPAQLSRDLHPKIRKKVVSICVEARLGLRGRRPSTPAAYLKDPWLRW